MKKILIILFLSIICISHIFSVNRSIRHSYTADYSLFPETPYTNKYVKKLNSNYDIHYCVQSIISIPKKDAKGYNCEQILQKLDQMGGIDKECFGVSYIDGKTGERKPIFKKSRYDFEKNTLYIKDKAAGGLNFDVGIDTFQNSGNIYVVNAIVNKRPDNIFVGGIKKREAEIFVFMQEESEVINVYALIQCSYNPLDHKFLKSYVESAVTARVLELQNWFYRMLCKE